MAFSPSWGMTEVGLPTSPGSFQLTSALTFRDQPAPAAPAFEKQSSDPQAEEPILRSDGLKAILAGVERDDSLVLFLDPNFSVEKHVAESVRAGSVAYALENAERAASLISANVREEVIRRQDALLGEVEAVGALEQEVSFVSEGVTNLSSATDKLVKALADPYQPMKEAVTKLQNLHDASEILRKVALFKTHTAKLREVDVFGPSSGASPMPSADALSAAAEAVRELELMGQNGDFAIFERIEITRRDVPMVRKAADNVKRKTAESLLDSLKRVSKADVGAALYAFHVLGCLDDRVQAELARLISVVSAAVLDGFDPRYNPRGLSAADDKQRDIWSKIDAMTEAIALAATQGTLLHMVLEHRQDPHTLSRLSSFVSTKNGNSISRALIEMMGNTIADQVHILYQSANRRAGGLPALNALSQDFPRLRARFLALKERIVAAGSSLLSTSDRECMVDANVVEVCLLRGISEIEETYVAQSLRRLMDPTQKMFEAPSPTPGEAEALGLAKLFATELALTRDDSKLSARTARNIIDVVRQFLSSAESRVSAIHTKLSSDGNSSSVAEVCTLHNAMHCLESATTRLAVTGDLIWPEETQNSLQKVCSGLTSLSEVLLGPIFSDITVSMETILLRIHEENLEEERDSEFSAYMEDATAKLANFRKAIASRSLRSRVFSSYAKELGRRCLDHLTTQVSLLLSLTDESKTRITADLAQAEYAVASICTVQDITESYASSRAMRKLLFVSTWELLEELENPDSSATKSFKAICGDLRPSLILNHIITRGPPTLVHPHRRKGVSSREYSQWMQSASESVVVSEIQASLETYSKAMENSEGALCDEFKLCSAIASTLLADFESRQTIE